MEIEKDNESERRKKRDFDKFIRFFLLGPSSLSASPPTKKMTVGGSKLSRFKQTLPCDWCMMIYYKTMILPAFLLWALSVDVGNARRGRFCRGFDGTVEYVLGQLLIVGIMCTLASTWRDYHARYVRWTSLWIDGMGYRTLVLFRFAMGLLRLLSNLMTVLVTMCFLAIKIMCVPWLNAFYVFLMILMVCMATQIVMGFRKTPRNMRVADGGTLLENIP